MKKSIIICLLLAACALDASASGVAGCPAIRPDHPRIFFNSDTWPEIKARAEGPAREYRDNLLKAVDALTDNPVASGTEAVNRKTGRQADGTYVSEATGIKVVKEYGTESAMCALAWRLTGERKYLEKTKKMLRASIDGYTAATANHRPVNWYSTTRINCICAYDWIYEALTDDERRSFIVPLAEHVRLIQPEAGYKIPRQPPGSKVTGFYGMASLLWYSGLAAYGDGFCDELAAQQLSDGYKKFMEVIEFRSETAGDDGALISPALNYAMGVYPYAHFNFFYSYLSATGNNIADNYPDMALFPYLLWWSWIRDAEAPVHFRSFGISDAHHHDNLIDHSMLFDHLSNYIHFWGKSCPEATEFAMALREYSPVKKFSKMFPVYPFIMDTYGSAGDEMAEMVKTSPLKARHFETVGHILMRSGWTPDATYCCFTAGAQITQHKHYDDNNFIIYKYDHLALDTGDRALQNDLNLAYYYGQSVAHNVILIQKEDEKLSTFWGSKTDDPAANRNYGGQVELDGSKVIGFETNDDYTYVASDATKSYGSKAGECVRQFVFLYPDYFVVYDRVESSDAGYEKDWLLHFKNKPVIKGNLLRADSGEGRLFCQTFLPADRRIDLIGGPGKEFWVRDRNFEISPKSIERDKKELTEPGRGPYYGAWRIELKPTDGKKEARFLNVLTATSTKVAKPVPAKYLKDGSRDGVRLKINGKNVTVWFNRSGEVGGEIEIDGTARALTTSVQPQSGILMDNTQAYKKPKFKPYEIPGLEQKPGFWKVRPSEVIDVCKSVRKGRVEVVAKTPLGYPVYAVYYGDFSEDAPATNWSAGNSSSTKKAYLGKEGHPQTIMLVAGVHGSEPESVAAAMNMIQLLETGKDFRGREDAEFLELASRYRLIIMPCVNMDGRLVCPDHFRNQPYEVFRAASQGVWKDGSLIGWLGSKEWFPLPLDRVSFPGGYPNSEGVNIQHDVAPGDMKSEEAKAVCRVAARWRVDFCLNSHTCEGVPFVRYPSQIETPGHIETGRMLSDAANKAIFEAGLVDEFQQQKPSNETLNLTNIINWCSGGLGLTLECAHSCYTSKGHRYEYSFDQMVEPPFIVLKLVMKEGSKLSLSGR